MYYDAECHLADRVYTKISLFVAEHSGTALSSPPLHTRVLHKSPIRALPRLVRVYTFSTLHNFHVPVMENILLLQMSFGVVLGIILYFQVANVCSRVINARVSPSAIGS